MYLILAESDYILYQLTPEILNDFELGKIKKIYHFQYGRVMYLLTVEPIHWQCLPLGKQTMKIQSIFLKQGGAVHMGTVIEGGACIDSGSGGGSRVWASLFDTAKGNPGEVIVHSEAGGLSGGGNENPSDGG
jgi:hypothetical protein